MFVTARQLSQFLGGELEGDPDVKVSKPSKIEEAGEGSLTFLANPKYEQFVYETKASVLLVSMDFSPSRPLAPTLIRVEDVYESLGKLLTAFDQPQMLEEGISEHAYVHDKATIGENVTIAPSAYVGAGAIIGANSVIYPQVFVGPNVQVGSDCKLFPGVKIYHSCQIGDRCVIHSNAVIGSDGFGYSQNLNGAYSKIAQVGNVRVEDDVEIGANTVIDRATMGSTIIRRGVKLDNLIQIAHNVEIGENTVIAAQAGVAGSTKLGKKVRVGGQVGFVGHIQIADGVEVQAQSGVTTSVTEPGQKMYGSPAFKYMDFLKAFAIFRKLPNLQKRVNNLERQLSELKGDSSANSEEQDSK